MATKYVHCILYLTLIIYKGINAKSVHVDLKIILDHDGGADDALAILLALNYEKYFNGPQVIGLTTTHGNVDEPQAFINTQRILHTAGRQDIPVYRGANYSLVETTLSDKFYGSDGLGDNDFAPIVSSPPNKLHAVLALIEHSKKYKGRLIVISIGALTNIALAIRLDPLFLGRLNHLYVGGGTVHSDAQPDAEFNARSDVEAYYAVLDNASPNLVTILPMSTVRESNFSVSWRTDVFGKIPSSQIEALNQYERISLTKTNVEWGWDALDPAMTALAIEQRLVKDAGFVKNSIILCGQERGINTNVKVEFDEANVKMIYAIEKEAYMNFLFELFWVGTDMKKNMNMLFDHKKETIKTNSNWG